MFCNVDIHGSMHIRYLLITNLVATYHQHQRFKAKLGLLFSKFDIWDRIIGIKYSQIMSRRLLKSTLQGDWYNQFQRVCFFRRTACAFRSVWCRCEARVRLLADQREPHQVMLLENLSLVH